MEVRLNHSKLKRLALWVAALWLAVALGACALGRTEREPPEDHGHAGQPPHCSEWPFDAEEARHRQEETARVLGLPVEKEVDLGGGLGMKMVLIPPGKFMMGSPERKVAWRDESPAHEVHISRPFYLGKHEVTQGQWQRVMGVNPSRFEGDERRPVEQVSWHDCLEFAERLTSLSQGTFRLPTEAEWEYACRAGTATALYSGDRWNQIPPIDVDPVAWHTLNSPTMAHPSGSTHPVGQKEPNAWGLYDMLGNVEEWTQSLYREYPYRADDGREDLSAADPRVLRGGCFFGGGPTLRSAFRRGAVPSVRKDWFGLRIALSTCDLRNAACTKGKHKVPKNATHPE